MKNFAKICDILKSGGIGVLPTDTIYGLVGSALNKKTVERIYKTRKRNPKKPCIILIGDICDLKLFGIKVSSFENKILGQVWPGEVSVVLPCSFKKFSYLHRGTGTLAFRLPSKKSLLKLLKITGPLIAPSANFEGELVAETVRDARKSFGNNVDFYLSEGRKNGMPSTLIEIKNKKVKILRQGKVMVGAVVPVTQS